MAQGPLTEDEIVWLDDVLLKYSTLHSVMDVSELDGLLTSMLSVPGRPEPATVLRAVWGEGREPEWESREELTRFNVLVFQHMNDIAERLADYPEQFEPLFGTCEVEGREMIIVEAWCHGYMRGVSAETLARLPTELQPVIGAIALHVSDDESCVQLHRVLSESFLLSLEDIKPAVMALYSYWHGQHEGEVLH